MIDIREFIDRMTFILYSCDTFAPDTNSKDGIISNGLGWREDGVDELAYLLSFNLPDPRSRKSELNRTFFGWSKSFSVGYSDYIMFAWEKAGGRLDHEGRMTGLLRPCMVFDHEDSWLQIAGEEKEKCTPKPRVGNVMDNP